MNYYLAKLFIIILFLSILIFKPSISQTHEFIVKQVLNSNTIILDNDKVVKYIGVEKVSSELFSRNAYEFNKSLVEGKKIRLEFDELSYDDKGNILAYVFLDDVFINAKIIEQGYGSVFIISPNIKYADMLIKLEREARSTKIGMWSDISSTQSLSNIEYDITSLLSRISSLENEVRELKRKINELTQVLESLRPQKENKEPEILRQEINKDMKGDSLVHISAKSGKKYHKQNCKFLSDDNRSITLEEALKNKYEPCKICFPEQSKPKIDKAQSK